MLKKIAILLVILGFLFILMLLTTGESHFSVQSEVHYSASPEALWLKLENVDRWPDWWPGMEEAKLVGALRTGSEIHIRLKGMPSADRASLVLERPPYELVWEGSGIFGSRAGTRVNIEPDTLGSHMSMENFVVGPQAFLARFTGEDAFVKYQQALLDNFGISLGGPSSSGEKSIESALPVD